MIKRTKQFGDIELYQMVKRTRTRFSKILTDMQKTVKVSGTAVQMCQKFRECLKPTEEIDESRLPLYSRRCVSLKKNKLHTIMCVISHTIQLYWELAQGHKDRIEEIESFFIVLEGYTKHGLRAYKLSGSISTGYYLEKR